VTKIKKGARVKEAKSAEVEKLKQRIRRLQKDKRELITKLNTLERAFERNVRVLKGSTEDLSVEELIEAANEDKTIKEVKDEKSMSNCPNCGTSEIRTIGIRGGNVVVCTQCNFRGKL